MIHLSIQGPQAVGKTTALRQLDGRLTDCLISYEFPYPTVAKRNALGLDITTEAGFMTNQRLFIREEVTRYASLMAPCVVFDRGPEDTECYTLNYPKVLGKNWPIEEWLAAELRDLRSCRIDRILYLDAPAERLLENKQRDTCRSRRSFDLKAFQIYRDWYAGRSDCDFLDTAHLSKSEVIAEVEHWINLHKTANSH